MRKLGKKANVGETIEAYMTVCGYCSCYCNVTDDPKAIEGTIEKITGRSETLD